MLADESTDSIDRLLGFRHIYGVGLPDRHDGRDGCYTIPACSHRPIIIHANRAKPLGGQLSNRDGLGITGLPFRVECSLFRREARCKVFRMG